MITREEKNKEDINEINREKAINISKKILHIAGIIMLIFILFFAYIYFIGVKGLFTNEFIIKDTSIPKSFHGVKILHFSDLLYGSTIKESEIKTLLEEIKLVNPDLVFFTGNMIYEKSNLSEEDINTLNDFFKEIPYTIGKYAIKGDLDNQSFNLILENTNFTILNNEIQKVYNNDESYINIVGLSNKIDIIQKKDDNYTITLINNYDNYKEYNIKSNLVFAGHNLGGEIRLFNIPLLGNNQYNNLYYEENNKTYISNGLGSIHHMRFMNHPSINVYRLYNK